MKKKINTDSKYYVYQHTFSDGSIYIGKGTGRRKDQFTKGRSSVYIDLLRATGNPNVYVLKENLSEVEAYDFEHSQIAMHRDSGSKIINRTDGLEKTNIGTMPPRTLLFADKSKAHPKYKQIVHLKSTEREGSYIIGATIIEAAIKINITCDELIEKLNNKPNLTIGKYKFITQEEAIKAAPHYENTIIEIS